jgi:hypothetical protein
LFSLGVFKTNGDFEYFPHKTKDREKDTLNYGFKINKKTQEKSFQYKFRRRNYKDMYVARYAFDLSLDSLNRYAVCDIRFMYGNNKGDGQVDKRRYYDDFLKVTKKGKNFIYSINKGNFVMLFPEKCTKTFSPIPDEMTTYYNTKYMEPYVFGIPKEIENKEILNYLVKQYVLIQE